LQNPKSLINDVAGIEVTPVNPGYGTIRSDRREMLLDPPIADNDCESVNSFPKRPNMSENSNISKNTGK
jgi:hypothetical protein